MDARGIDDKVSLTAWVTESSREDAIAVVILASSRVFPLFTQELESLSASNPDFSTVSIFRAAITSMVARIYPESDVKVAALAAYSDALAAERSIYGVNATASMAARAICGASSVAYVAYHHERHLDAGNAVSLAAAAPPNGRDAIWKSVRGDIKLMQDGQDPFGHPLWGEAHPIWFDSADKQTRAIWAKNPVNWDFWVRWWDGVIAGKPLDWELQKQVALIPDEEWQKGPDHIASLIRQIEAGLAQTQDIDPKAPKPETARYLTQNRLVARMQAQGLAGQIVDVIERYVRDTGCNDLPDEFQALRSIPAVLLELGRKLADAATTEDDLRAEVQRLNARVLRLEADLREAKARTLTGTFSKSFVEQAGKSLGDWKMWGALIGGVSYLGGVPAMVDAAQSIADSVQGIFGDQLPEPPHADLPASPELPRLTDL